MKTVSSLAVLFLVVAALGLPASAQDTVSASLVFMRSSDAPASVSRAQVSHCLQQLVRAMNLDGRGTPRVLVLNVSEGVAQAVGLSNTTVRRNSGADGTPVYFELWVVGDAPLKDYVVGLLTILEYHFGLKYTVEQRRQVFNRVVRYLNATVEVPG